MPKPFRALTVAMLLLWAAVRALSAGVTAASDSPFIIDAWSNEEGLPQSAVLSVIQTHDGYLWLGTLNGLVRFDGNRFTVFDQNTVPGLSSDRILALFEDSRTNFWVWTESAGLYLVQNGKILRFNIASGATGGGRLPFICQQNFNNVSFYASDGRFFFYENGNMQSFPSSIIPSQLLLQATKVTVASRSGGFWQLQGVVQKWDGGRLEKEFGAVPWDRPVSAACEDRDGNLVVGTLGSGIYWYKPDGTFRHLTNGISSIYILSMCTDREGNLWVGTDGGGLDRIKRNVFKTPEKLHPWAAQSLSLDTNGGLWIAYGAPGASYLHGNSVQDFQVGPLHDAWTILVDRQQNVWAGTHGDGLYQFTNGNFNPAPGAAILGAQIFALFEDRDGRIWAGTQNGLANWSGGSWKLFSTHDGLSDNTVRAIAQDADGGFWIGTENGGLNFFKDGKFTVYQKSNDGLPGNDISCLCLDHDGVLWIGTAGHGLARFYRGKWTRYSTWDGLASNSIDYIIEDDDGNLWVGSNAGLMRIQKKSLNDSSNGSRKILCRTFGKADGLPTRECSAGSQPAAIREADGTLWLPTTLGAVSVNPKQLKPNPHPPLVVIESVLVDGVEQMTNEINSLPLQIVTVPAGSERLEIHYTGLNFSAPKLVHFRYRMEGHENAWTDARDLREVTYHQMPPGDYRFHVIAGNEDGIWNDTGATLIVKVQPRFWQTAWFRGLMIFVFTGIIAASVRVYFHRKLRRQARRLQQQEALERERARIARDLHDQLGANLTQIALLGEMTESDKNVPEEVELNAQQIAATARDTTRSLDEIVWAVNPSNDTIEGLANYMCKYAQDYFALAGLRYRVEAPPNLAAVEILPDVRHNVFLAFKEAVNNVVKHAQATEARLRLQLQPDRFVATIEDNGRGINLETDSAKMRNGLKNMRKRMQDVGGEFLIEPRAEGGTKVRLVVPVQSKTAE